MQMHDIITQAYMHSAVYNMIKVASQWWLLQATDLLCKVKVHVFSQFQDIRMLY